MHLTTNRHRRRFLQQLGLAAFAAGLPWLNGCSKSSTLTVALHLWVGYEPLYLARDFNWLPPTIVLREDATLGDSLTALRSGAVDAACMTLDEMLRARAVGLPLSAALVFDVSAGADMVLARPEIATLADLKQKRIGFDPGAVGALVFAKLLEAANLTEDMVIPLATPPAMQLEAWRKGDVDAVITYEPFASSLLTEGAKSLYDSRQMPDTIIDVLAVRHDRDAALPLLHTLANAHFRALDYFRGNREDTIRRIAARESISREQARLALASVTLPTLAANHGYLHGEKPGLIHAAGELSRLMVKHGLLAREDNLQQLILPDALPETGG